MSTTLINDLFLEFVSKINPCHTPSGPSGGQFCHVGGGGGITTAPVVGVPKVKVLGKKPEFKGAPVAVNTPMSKLEVGTLGEKLVASYLQTTQNLKVKTLNVKVNNFPVDLMQDHGAIEVKAGLISNGTTAQHWRATIGQPGKAEQAWLKKATPEQKAKFNEKKAQAILDRKQQALEQISAALGKKVKPHTYTVIINPDTKKADIYHFNGFHLRIPWNSPQAKAGYVGTVAYNV